jgi:hypothetical protein
MRMRVFALPLMPKINLISNKNSMLGIFSDFLVRNDIEHAHVETVSCYLHKEFKCQSKKLRSQLKSLDRLI